MRVLVVHAWMRGNLGDVLQFSVLLSALRDLRPRVLDLAGFPARPDAATLDVVACSDRYLTDPFIWYWKFAPRLIEKSVIEPRWRAQRAALFAQYDVIVCAPGPYLADYDARAKSALCDIEVANELGRPLVLSNHSIGPLQPAAISAVARAAVRIAREPSTHAYLERHGLSSVLSADLAFLYPYAEKTGPPPIEPPYRLVFLRSNNLNAKALRLEGGALFEGTRLIAKASSDRLVLATSDYYRDKQFLAATARHLGVPSVGCRSVAELVRLIRGSSSVVSDRYHPAICGAVLGKPAQVLSNQEPHKMHGLKSLLADHSVEALQDLARVGLRTVQDAVKAAV